MTVIRNYNFVVGDRVFQTGTHVMGILNVTPDSFYAPSRVRGDIADRAGKMLSEGAEIIDIGGQSTRPGSADVSVLEELGRVVPAVETIKREFPNALISVDTFNEETARRSVSAGADMINDVSGQPGGGLLAAVAESGVALCIMHNRRKTKIPDLFSDIFTGLETAVERALKAGVDKNKILLDGGVGFTKSNAEDRLLLDGYGRLADEMPDYPFLLGTSRKSMFGGAAEGRLSATVDSTVFAAMQGILFVRVHDVKENALAVKSVKIR